MCGIFGIIASKNNFTTASNIQVITNNLFRLSESRGKEAAGILITKNGLINSYKEPIRANSFVKKKIYKGLFVDVACKSPEPLVIIGHARLTTNGLQTDNKNNQPIITNNTLGVHNGIIVNETNIWQKILNKKPSLEVDTEVIFELINFFNNKGFSLVGSIQKTYQAIEGSANLAIMSRYSPNVYLTTNTGSLYTLFIKNPKIFVFASEKYILEAWLKNTKKIINLQSIGKINHLPAQKGIMISPGLLSFHYFSLKNNERVVKNSSKICVYKLRDYSKTDAKADKKTLTLYQNLNSLKKLKQHNFNYRKIYKLRRCTKCILPETTPFIKFNTEGVCNYCRDHQKISYKGSAALRKFVQPFRSKNGDPDCILAFSGGRDSSYGLHYLKNELGLNPIAYTYDWGMVKDIARRNQARLVGKLGVEHIIVSADITMKRNHIRNHILAWLKKPNLGMVPLFMEGDKQCEYYADQLAKKNNIRLIFFCRGNEFEKEEFKTGHCGIKNADPKGIIHNLSLEGKIRLAIYYGWQYLTNPHYINSSFFDTLFAYFSTYIQKHNYVFLWHYIPWNEQKIVSTIKQKYNWESDGETVQTWRTDDGTSSFYNYIYYAMQGFTENDSFRSRQVREGKITRAQALSMVHQENKPRHEALKWYFDQLGLDGDKVLSVIDNAKRLY